MRKWFIGTPATEEKKRKKRTKKASQANRSQVPIARAVAGSSQAVAAVVANDEAWDAIEGEGVNSSDEEDMLTSDGVEEIQRPEKRPKPEPPTEFTAYIDIISPPRTVKAKETSTARGPFFFYANTTHLEFLSLLAACAVDTGFSAAVTTINQSQLVWKLITPANDKKKPLSSEQGYRALLNKMNELSAKKKECTVTLSMPPLSKVANGSRSKVRKCP